MRRYFVKNIFFLLLVNLIVKPVWIFAIDRNVQNVVGHEQYGQYQALLSFSIIFQIVLDFGLQSYNSRTLSQSPKRMASLFPNIVFAKALLSLVYFVLVMALGLLLGYKGHALFLLLLLSFVQILSSFLLYLRSNVSGLHFFKTDSLLSVSDRFFMIFVCGILLFVPPWSMNFKIEWFVYAQIASYVFTGAIAFFVCTKMVKINWNGIRLKKSWRICKKSLPYALLIFLMAVYLRSDAILIERMLPQGKEEAGVFAAAFRLLDVANNVSGVLFAGMLLPVFGRLIAKRSPILPIVRVSINLLLPMALMAMFTSWFLGNDIMHFLYTHATSYDGRVFSHLMVAFPGFCICYVYATLLTANGNLRQLIVLSCFAVLFNICANLVAVPIWGALGAATVAALTQVLLATSNLLISRRIFRLKHDVKWILQYVLFSALALLVCFVLSRLDYSLYLQLALVALTTVALMFVCGFVPIKKIKETLLNKV